MLQGIFMKTDSLGNEIVRRYHPEEARDASIALEDIVMVHDSLYIVTGNYGDLDHLGPNDVGVDSFSYYAVGINQNLEVLWERKLDTTDFTSWETIAPAHGRNVILTGWNIPISSIILEDRPPDTHHATASLSLMTPEGQVLWHRNYAASSTDAIKTNRLRSRALATSDGGYIAVGESATLLDERQVQNVWVLKVDSVGCIVPGCDDVLITDVPELEPQVYEFRAYPNPTTSIVTLDFSEELTLLGYKVLSATGQEMSHIQMIDRVPMRQLTVDLSSYPSAMYRVAMRFDHGWEVINVVKS